MICRSFHGDLVLQEEEDFDGFRRVFEASFIAKHTSKLDADRNRDQRIVEEHRRRQISGDVEAETRN